MKLAISLATRQRPGQLVETIAKSVKNWRDPNTVMWVMADNDDPLTSEQVNAASAAGMFNQKDVRVKVGPREDTIAEKWNRVVKLAPDADCYLIAADDDPYITEGYDSLLLKAAQRFPDGIGMVYGNMANASFSGAVCPTARLVQLMGHKIFPEYFPYWFADHWTDDIARIIGRISFADIRTDQTMAGKTQEMREPGWWATWFDAAYIMRRREAHAIVNAADFASPDWLKDILLTHHPLIEYRSRWINSSVRANDRNYQQWSGLSTQDPRYQRVKQQAVAMLPKIFETLHPEERKMFEAALIPQTVPNLARVG